MVSVALQSLDEPSQQPRPLARSRVNGSVRARPLGARLKRRAMMATDGKTATPGQLLHIRGSAWKPFAGTIVIFDLHVIFDPGAAWAL